jgi:hypothetical protein
MVILIIVLVMISTALIFMRKYFFKDQDREYKKMQNSIMQSNSEYAQVYFDMLYNNKALETTFCDITLKKNELPYMSEYASIVEMTNMTVTDLGFNRISITPGRNKDNSYSKKRNVRGMYDTESGNLVLTEARLIFNGSERLLEFKIENILNMRTTWDSIIVSYEGKVKHTQFRVDNPIIWKGVFEILKDNSRFIDFPHVQVKDLI